VVTTESKISIAPCRYKKSADLNTNSLIKIS